MSIALNPLSASPAKWSNTFKQFVGKLPTNCLSVFDHFVKLALKGLTKAICIYGGASELLSFKNSIYIEKYETLTNRKSEKYAINKKNFVKNI